MSISEMFGSETDRAVLSLPGMSIVLGIISLSVSFSLRVWADDTDYTPLVTLKGAKVLEVPGKKPTKSKARSVEFLFDIDENVPVGAKIEFGLEYRFRAIARFVYVYKGGRRTGIKFVWTPKIRLPVDTYMLFSSMPLKIQTPKVRKAIERKKERFPPLSEPWSWFHKKEEFILGTEAEQKAEEMEVAKFFKDWADRLVKLNGEFVESCEEAEAKTKFVKGDKLDKDAFKGFVVDWMKRTAAVQLEIMSFPETQPGLWVKNQAATYQTQNLSFMVAKRCYTYKLKETLSKFNLKISDLGIPGVRGFQATIRSSSSPQAMTRLYKIIADLAKFAEPEDPKPNPPGGKPGSGSGPDSGKKDPPKGKDAPKGQDAVQKPALGRSPSPPRALSAHAP